MKKINLRAAFGDVDKDVELSMPVGGGETYHLYIDRFYYGKFIKRAGQWEFADQDKSSLTSADITVLIDLIDNADQ